VIDDQPEVTNDDPNFLFDKDDGFQEVQSKKAMKIKQKAQEAETRKLTADSQMMAENAANAGGKKGKDVVSKVSLWLAFYIAVF